MLEAEIRAMVAAGMTRKQIAAAFGITLDSANYWLCRYGLRTFGRFRVRMPEDEIRTRVAAGQYRREIAVWLGCSKYTLDRYLAKIGLKTNGRPNARPKRIKRSYPRIAQAGSAANPFGI